MPKIVLKTPVELEGKTWSEIDFNPSLGALRAFECATEDREPSVNDLISLLTADGDTPEAVAEKVRMEDLIKVKDVINSPLDASSPASVSGEE